MLFTLLILESNGNGKNVPQKFLLDLLDKAIEITKSAGKIQKGRLRNFL